MPVFGWIGFACGLIALLLFVCALCESARTGDDLLQEEIGEFYTQLDMPRCRCGTMLDSSECERGECDVCRRHLRVPRVRGGEELVPAPIRRRYREMAR